MPYINPFTSVITTTKRNNRYYGPTESAKMSSFLSEVQCDLNTLFDEFNNVQEQFNALASGYFNFQSNPTTLYYMKDKVTHYLNKINNRIIIQAQNIAPGL